MHHPTDGCPISSAFFALEVGGNTVDNECVWNLKEEEMRSQTELTPVIAPAGQTRKAQQAIRGHFRRLRIISSLVILSAVAASRSETATESKDLAFLKPGAQFGYWCRFAPAGYGVVAALCCLCQPDKSNIGLVPTKRKTWLGSLAARDHGESAPIVASKKALDFRSSLASVFTVLIFILLSTSDSALAADLTRPLAVADVITRLPPTADAPVMHICQTLYPGELTVHPAFGLTFGTMPRKVSKSCSNLSGSACIVFPHLMTVTRCPANDFRAAIKVVLLSSSICARGPWIRTCFSISSSWLLAFANRESSASAFFSTTPALSSALLTSASSKVLIALSLGDITPSIIPSPHTPIRISSQPTVANTFNPLCSFISFRSIEGTSRFLCSLDLRVNKSTISTASSGPSISTPANTNPVKINNHTKSLSLECCTSSLDSKSAMVGLLTNPYETALEIERQDRASANRQATAIQLFLIDLLFIGLLKSCQAVDSNGTTTAFPSLFLKGDRQSGCILNTVPHMHFGSPPYSVVP